MSAAEIAAPESDWTRVIRPNRALSGRAMLAFFAVVALLSILVGVRFWLLGAWVVMPFVALEVLIFGGALYLFHCATNCSEHIRLDQDSLEVLRWRPQGVQSWEFQPYWVRVVLARDPRRNHPSRLMLRSHGRELEIGHCLTEEQRLALWVDLQQRLDAIRVQTVQMS